jgi:hypothetical protein
MNRAVRFYLLQLEALPSKPYWIGIPKRPTDCALLAAVARDAQSELDEDLA